MPNLGVRAQVAQRKRLYSKTSMPEAGSAWLAKRRRDVARLACNNRSSTSGTGAEDTAMLWTDKHEAELKHQRQKRKARALAAVEDGVADTQILGERGDAQLAEHRQDQNTRQ